MKLLSQKLKQRGQGMTEYIIIVALIAVAAIGVYMLFGSTIRHQTAGIAMEVAGQQGQTEVDAAGTAASAAATAAASKTSLSTYGNQATKAGGGAGGSGGTGGQ